MEPKFLIILLLTTYLSSSFTSSTSTTIVQQNKYSTFIKRSCRSTTYPIACVKSLIPYATTVKTSPLKLTIAALSTALKTANTTLVNTIQLSKTKPITKFEAAVLKDCIGDIKDSMDEIKSSITELTNLGKSSDRRFAISNAQTWTSAAITDENSCLDGFSDGKVSPIIKQKMTNSVGYLTRVSSNALYLINHLSV